MKISHDVYIVINFITIIEQAAAVSVGDHSHLEWTMHIKSRVVLAESPHTYQNASCLDAYYDFLDFRFGFFFIV